MSKYTVTYTDTATGKKHTMPDRTGPQTREIGRILHRRTCSGVVSDVSIQDQHGQDTTKEFTPRL